MEHEMSVKEAQEKLLLQLWDILDYWEKLEGKTKREAMEGMLFTFLASGFDGSGLNVPPMKIIPIVPKEDQKYHIENHQKYFPTKDIGGGLHELVYRVGKKHGYLTS